MVWPSCFDSGSRTMRPRMSMVLPAENGTIARIGLAVGHAAWANADRTRVGAANALDESWRNLRRLCVSMLSPGYCASLIIIRPRLPAQHDCCTGLFGVPSSASHHGEDECQT